MRRRFLVGQSLYPGIAIVRFNYFIGHHFDVLLYHVVFKATTDQTLDRKQGVIRISHRLAFSRLSNQHFPVIGKSDGRRCCPSSFGIFYNFWLVAFHYGHTGISGSQINSDYLAHVGILHLNIAINSSITELYIGARIQISSLSVILLSIRRYIHYFFQTLSRLAL